MPTHDSEKEAAMGKVSRDHSDVEGRGEEMSVNHSLARKEEVITLNQPTSSLKVASSTIEGNGNSGLKLARKPAPAKVSGACCTAKSNSSVFQGSSYHSVFPFFF